MTTQTTPAAERASQLAAQREQIEKRRADLAAELAELEQQQNTAARDAYAARPDVAQQRTALAGAVATLTQERREAIRQGRDTADVDRRLIEARVGLELADADLAEVDALAAQVEAEILAEQRAAQFDRLVAQIAEADAAVSAWLAGVDPALADAVADVEAIIDRLIATMTQGQPAADHATNLRAQAAHLAAQLGRPVPPAAVADPVNAAHHALPANHLPLRRLYFAATHGNRAGVAASLTENVRR